MVGKRDSLGIIINYLESLGININIGKNKARGNKGFFSVKNNEFRIDVSNKIESRFILNTLVHEFAHYIHYQYDKSLKSLNFIFGENMGDELMDELITLTVDLIPKRQVAELFDLKTKIKFEIKDLKNKIYKKEDGLSFPEKCKDLEKKIKKTPYIHLLKYDNVQIKSFFKTVKYSIKNINNFHLSEEEKLYLKMLSQKRMLHRINSRISKMNKYYNTNSELFARSLELYFLDVERFKIKAPKVYEIYRNSIISNKIPLLSEFENKMLIYKNIN